MTGSASGPGVRRGSSTALAGELEDLLGEDLAAARERERSAFDAVASPHEASVVLFGAGNLGRMAARGLRSAGIEPLAFADSNPAGKGATVDGIRVLSLPEAAAEFGDDAVFVVTIWGAAGKDRMTDRVRQLEVLGCRRVVPFGQLFWKYPDALLPHYILDRPSKVLEQAGDVREAFGLLADEASRREFVAQLRWRLWMDFDALPAPAKDSAYFPDDLCEASATDVLIDCGAFDGDTVKDFLRLRGEAFGRIIAFEPDPVNRQRLADFLAAQPAAVRDRIEVRPEAVGRRAGKLRFSVTGTAGSSAGQGDHEVAICALDEALAGIDVSWIKMDIEGFEADALEGARRLIGTSRPVLAINLEHKQEDLWRIPILLDSLADDYCLFLRPYLLEGWDLVCYAIPAARCRKHPGHGGDAAA